MDFDSSLFDLPFEDLASLGMDSQQQAMAPGAMDFEDFCKDFASANDFDADLTNSQTPVQGAEAVPQYPGKPASVSAKELKTGDFLDGLDKAVFDPLEPFDSNFEDLFGSNVGNDAQVVPSMTPSDANVPEFTLPTFTHAPYAFPKSSSSAPGISRPYSWMNGMDYASFGWPARTRLPSKLFNWDG